MNPPLHVALVEPEIHWNTGNVGRTCLAAGAQLHLVKPLGFSLDAREVKRAGLDYWERVKPMIWDGFDAFEAELPALGEPWFFTPEARRAYWDVSYFAPLTRGGSAEGVGVVLVLGKESVGFSKAIRERYSDRLVRIPQRAGAVRSLNLSSSAAIAIYEVVRQRELAAR
jgi:tRNA (cytidine/uridine-2'-O-)-methyltransferase